MPLSYTDRCGSLRILIHLLTRDCGSLIDSIGSQNSPLSGMPTRAKFFRCFKLTPPQAPDSMSLERMNDLVGWLVLCLGCCNYLVFHIVGAKFGFSFVFLLPKRQALYYSDDTTVNGVSRIYWTYSNFLKNLRFPNISWARSSLTISQFCRLSRRCLLR